ncbi:B12-binding domain-containing radical SAM protein [Magnetospirillum moscoviense]|uniref:Radical SAM core domain-containing protein n=1 Tax=Magnetospirillum moscoviense TaxID=1437059 RepID=A0A178M570_9PROT|nr:radical SAM protein [Magnetospirillum moscoviense]OAN43902.1 hypothetical protein A6A05_17785 [Magnetospirillum moscoviense]
MAGRGCVYQCTYCVNALLTPMHRGNGKPVRLRSVDNVVAELVEAHRRTPNARHVCFHDEVFAMYGEWLADFRDKYKDAVGLPFECELVPKLIREENVRLLVDAGLTEMGFGIQSGDKHVRTVVMKRPGGNDELVAKARVLHDHGVHGRYDLILDNPFESEQDLEESIDLLLRFPQPLQLFTYKMQYFPGYPFTEAALKEGYITQAMLTDEAVAQSTMYNWNFKPHMNWTRRNQLQNALYLFSLNSPLLRRMTLKVRAGRAPLAGLVLDVAAFLFYQYNVRHNPVLVWGRRIVLGLRMLASGDVGTLARLSKRVLGRFRTAHLSR